MEEITKSQLIEMWSLYCKQMAHNPDVFSQYSESYQLYNLRINDKISLNISFNDKTYEIALVFFDIIRHKVFLIDESEFSNLLLMWEIGYNQSVEFLKNKQISEGLAELQNVMSQIQSTN